LSKTEKIFTIILAVSSFLLANVLMKPRSITIIVSGKEAITIQTPPVYTLAEVLIILICSILIGISSTSILLSMKGTSGLMPKVTDISSLVMFLEGPERKIMEFIVKKGGEVLQREIWAETGLSKVTVSRVLRNMERKGLIRRKKYGGTKIVVISDRISLSKRRDDLKGRD